MSLDKNTQAIRDAIISSFVGVPAGHKVTKIGFWENSDGNVKYIKFYDGEELLFTLDFVEEAEAQGETWSIVRS